MKRKWTVEKIEEELLKSIDVLMLKRMPTSEELRLIGRNDLHVIISRTKKYSGWAEHLGLSLKYCETRMGNKYEKIAKEMLVSRRYEVEEMTTKHPYDLLVNGAVKVEVKAGKGYLLRGSRVHTFQLSKKRQTCDLYICFALSGEEEIERVFVIPSHKVSVVSISLGKNSKWNIYLDRWDYIEKYSVFYKTVI